MKRVLLPNAYAKAAEYAQALTPPQTVDDLDDTQIANYTCFYYEYDADRRQTKQVVFGGTNESTCETIISENAQDYNSWDRKTVETRLDGSTNTVYYNYLGQPLLARFLRQYYVDEFHYLQALRTVAAG